MSMAAAAGVSTPLLHKHRSDLGSSASDNMVGASNGTALVLDADEVTNVKVYLRARYGATSSIVAVNFAHKLTDSFLNLHSQTIE